MITGQTQAGPEGSRCGPWRDVRGVEAVVAPERHPDAPTATHWPMGEGMWLTIADHQGITLSRNRSSRGRAEVAVVVAVPGDDGWTLRRGPGEEASPRGLTVVDVLSPFDFRAPGAGSIVALQVPQGWLGLAPETVRYGLDRLRDANPLLGFVRDHVLHLGRLAADCPELLPDLAAPTSAVVRSLILTALDAGDQPRPSELVISVKNHIDAHLTDPGLCADTIAAAHHLSTRKLYSEWPSAEGRLNDYIIRRRLDRARDALVVRRHLTIPAVARAHGFSDATHFAKRFRAAYGISPSQWRRDNAVS
ncbi:transcriptional regulator, AraC superfamily protein [Gordonia terrae C-6]|uniref:Transcriptional regulator, AraC superfamily protein n=1 Tax=Gordonia terrae C-6 TaxID=1316928 RepID=R7Y664_9ACTN|nr:helix-turn-helix domain-containing protein [Gordonia terrae]EON31495.1 transcriptional regulator, AraC superfamily protein [Gordonia terrae C-6]